MLLLWLERLGAVTLRWLGAIGRATLTLLNALLTWPGVRGLAALVVQIQRIGVQSLPIIVLSAFSIGAVIALQLYNQLAPLGAEAAVGVGLAMVLLRELGPVVTALLFAGRAGSAITAEIGLMKTTEQLSSMSMMGVDPLHRVIAPRFWAGVLSLPLLTALFDVIAIFGGSLVAVDWLRVDSAGFWSGMQEVVELWNDVGKGMVKSLIFAVLVAWISVYQGYDAEPTSSGISAATTRTVVLSSVVVLASDFFLTLSFYGDFD
ncbi:MAG: lipid asymmetry maintenance ABC transporter permease subunit MlaE [Pseudomonadota bacterium]